MDYHTEDWSIQVDLSLKDEKRNIKSLNDVQNMLKGSKSSKKSSVLNALLYNKYLKALRLPTTNRLNASIPAIFTHLFTNYGDISPSELCTLTDQVQNMQFHPQEPVDTVFTAIDDLATIVEMAEAPLMQPQKINMAFLLFQKNTSVQ